MRYIRSVQAVSCCAFFVSLSIIFPAAVMAQRTLEEIVVTAQKREESLMDIPMAVTAFSGDQLGRIGMSDVRDMKTLVPTLHTGDNFNGNVTTTLRGVKDATSYYVDGIFLASQTSVMALAHDIERFEVLRGPQGTLYGKDASAGTINIINKQPTDETEASLQFSGGNYTYLAGRGVLNVPVSETFKLRGSFVIERRDTPESYENSIDIFGNPVTYSRDPGDGYFSIDKQGARLTALWEPRPDLSITVSGDWYLNNSPPTRQELQLPPQPPDPHGRWSRSIVTAPEYEQEIVSLRSRTEWAITDNLMFTYLLGWQDETIENIGSSVRQAPNTIVYSQPFDRSNYTHEFRLQSTSDRRFQWTVGGFYHFFDEDGDTEIMIWNEPLPTNSVPFTGILFGNKAFTRGNKAKSWAFFTHNTFDITEDIRLTVGARYTHDKKVTESFQRNNYQGGPANMGLSIEEIRNIGFVVFGPVLSAGDEWDNVSWKAGINWNVTDQHMLYFTASTGYKSGGFTVQNGTTFDEEDLLSLEAGLKSTILDGRLQFALTGFIYDYQDFQGSAVVPDGSGIIGQNITITTNAASASLTGVELEYNWAATENLRLMGHAAWMPTAKFDDYPNAPFDPAFLPLSGTVDLSGGRMPDAPKYEFSITGTYDYFLPNGATLSPVVNWSYTDDQFLRIYAKPIDREPGYHMLNASMRYTSADQKWYLEGFVHNATDEFARQAAFQSGFLSYNAIFIEPRLWGFRAGYNFF